MINHRAADYIALYNSTKRGPRYERVAHRVYKMRMGDPLRPEFEAEVIAGLKGFDMARTMKVGFPFRLSRAMEELRRIGGRMLMDAQISSIEMDTHRELILKAYQCFAPAGTLDPAKESHVAATKILHWLNPELFIIVDSNVARAFRQRFSIAFRDTTQPGYTPEKYLACLRHTQNQIRAYGPERFRTLERGTPEARIFDKIAFVVGMEEKGFGKGWSGH
jgi:hypothetical protein